MGSLPAGYDLFEYVTKTFRRWESMITILNNLDAGPKMEELALFIRHTDTVLYHSLCLPTLKDNKGRRQYIEQSLHIFSLICGAVFARVGGNVGDVLFTRLEVVFGGEARTFFGLFGELCHELLNGAQFEDNALHVRVAEILDECGLWAWGMSALEPLRELLPPPFLRRSKLINIIRGMEDFEGFDTRFLSGR